MSTFRNPVGPQPSRVYWRRRLVIGLGLLVVILIIVLIVARPAGKPTAVTTPLVTTSPSPTAASTPSGTVAACDPGVITVTPATDASVYAVGVQPQLSMTVTNTGAKACSFKVGSDVQVYTITSGADLIWLSTDCQTNPVPLVKTLTPNTPLVFPSFPWDRTRSDKTTCTSKRTPVVAGGATYHLSVTVDGVKSASSKPFILK